MKKQDYTKYLEKDLKKLEIELKTRMMKSYGLMGREKELPANRKRLRQEIAKILVEMSRRTKEK